jgi:hypothetical protein
VPLRGSVVLQEIVQEKSGVDHSKRMAHFFTSLKHGLFFSELCCPPVRLASRPSKRY